MATTSSSWIYSLLYRIILAAMCLTVTKATDVRWDMDESKWDAHTENSDVTLKCLVRHLNSMFAAVSIERSLNGKTELVVTNQVVEAAFRNLFTDGVRRYSSRFELLHENSGYMGVLQLTIKRIQGEDAGLVRCKAEGEATPLKTLAVRVPVDEVYMRMFYPNDSSIRVRDGATVYMRENRRSGVACSIVLRTQLIAPEVWLTSGGTNVTQLFSLEEPVLVEGAAHPTYMWQYTFYTLRPNNQLHDQRLNCMAYSVGFEKDVKMSQVHMDVEFRPTISCANYEYVGHVGGGITMSCAVKSNPKSQIMFRFGYYLSDNQYNVSKPFMTDGRYIFTRTESEGGVSNMSFTIRELRKAHFEYTYKLDTMNKYGSASVTLLLYENMVIGAASQVCQPLLAALLLVSLLANQLTSNIQR